MITLTVEIPEHTAIAFAKFLSSITSMAYKMTCSPGDNPAHAEYAGHSILRALNDAGLNDAALNPKRKRMYPPKKWEPIINEMHEKKCHES